jgi:hypothetical protein
LGGPGDGHHMVGAPRGRALGIDEMKSREREWDVHVLRPHFWRIGFWNGSGVWIPGEDQLGGVELLKRGGAIGGY